MLSLIKRKWIDHACPGFSWRSHWNFFHETLSSGDIKKIAMLGVYLGRDIAYIVSALRSAGVRDYSILGIDRFSDTAGEDWPAEKKILGWEAAGYGKPPALDVARRNLLRAGCLDNVTLVKGEVEEILKTDGSFDLIYIDICHDYQSTAKAIGLATQKIAPQGIIAGDDFSDEGTWGVASAVKDHFSDVLVFDNWIWKASAGGFKKVRDLLKPSVGAVHGGDGSG